MACSGHCVGDNSTPLRQDARLDTARASGCLGQKRTMFTAAVCPLPGIWIPGVHGVCYHNEIAALRMRSLARTPVSDERCRRRFHVAIRSIMGVASRYSESRWSYLQTAHSYTGALRRRYLQAERSLMLDGPVNSGDVLLKAFLKAEKRAPENMAKPRMIFPRSSRYNLHVASWLKPFEHWLWGNLKSRVFCRDRNTRVVAKGLSPEQRANLIRRKFAEIPDCVVFEVDGKAFEAHVEKWQLEAEHTVYGAAYPGDDELQDALKHQLRNFGITSCGVRFSRSGGRASGDFNTGMGNSIIMLAVVISTMNKLGAKVWDTLVDGDNALLFLPRCDSHWVHAGFYHAAKEISGHEMTLETCVDEVEKIRFGQSAPVFVNGRWQMVRDWRKVISHGTSSHVHLRERRYASEFLEGVARCESSLARGVPILWAWCRHLLAQTDVRGRVRLHGLRDYQVLGVDLDRLSRDLPAEPDEASRASFYRAFGVTPDEQIMLEKMVNQTQVRFDPWIPVDEQYRKHWNQF